VLFIIVQIQDLNDDHNHAIRPIIELQRLLSTNCRVESVYPPVLASDAEVNIVTVTVVCPGDVKHTIRAYRDEASALRDFIRINKLR
jgi:hypothetical protein